MAGDIPVSELVCETGSVAMARGLARSEQLYFAYINLDEIKSGDRLFARFAGAFAFPCYFGNNWNALYDCMTDLMWIRSRGFMLVLEGSLRLDTGGARIAEEILGDTVAHWFQLDLPFHVRLLHSSLNTDSMRQTAVAKFRRDAKINT